VVTLERKTEGPYRTPLGDNWGYCDCEKVQIDFLVCKREGKWVACMTELTGVWSLRVDVPNSVTGPEGNTEPTNFCSQATDLSLLSYQLTKDRWYLSGAISAHEWVHQAHLPPAWEAVEAAIFHLVSGMQLEDIGQDAAAAEAYMRVNLLPDVVEAALNIWYVQYSIRFQDDHGPGGTTDPTGPCYVQEAAVTGPMKDEICDHAHESEWGACAACSAP